MSDKAIYLNTKVQQTNIISKTIYLGVTHKGSGFTLQVLAQNLAVGFTLQSLTHNPDKNSIKKQKKPINL